MTAAPHARKDDHVRLADAQQARAQRSGPQDPRAFADVTFVHHACGGVDLDSVDTTTAPLGRRWAAPIYINAMTGGSDRTGCINAALAEVAAATGTPIASGSMSAFLKDQDTAPTFRTLREHNPEGFIFANLNANHGPDDAQRVIDLIAADALQIHVNLVQEIVMPEGDTSFGHWLTTIEAVADAVEVPVVVKEVGFGISARTARLLENAGVAAIDVGGSGGTNFAAIEDSRRADGAMFPYLHQWGQSTPLALIELDQDGRRVPVFASGGVRDPLDVARSLALGAEAVGVSGHFLHTLLSEGSAALHDEVVRWQEQLRALYGLIGATTTSGFTSTELMITGRLREECVARGLDPNRYLGRYADGQRKPKEEKRIDDDHRM